MKTGLRTLAAVAAGMILAMVMLVAVEAFAEMVHPTAPFKGDIPEQVRRYPNWVLGVVVVAWSGTALAATRVAAKIGHRMAGGIVAALLAWALGWNLFMLPYTAWFKAALAVAFPIASLVGVGFGSLRRPSGTGGRTSHE